MIANSPVTEGVPVSFDPEDTDESKPMEGSTTTKDEDDAEEPSAEKVVVGSI
jgi:hypothetical protein